MGITRMWLWGALTIASSIALAYVHEQQLGVLLLKANLIAAAAWAGYWIDRHAFPYARPHEEIVAAERAASYMRRAIIIGATMIAMALAL